MVLTENAMHRKTRKSKNPAEPQGETANSTAEPNACKYKYPSGAKKGETCGLPTIGHALITGTKKRFHDV
jgi:hypothetical protein